MYARHVVVAWGVAGMLLGAIVVYPAGSSAEAPGRNPCGGGHKLRILDLGMTPDPITAGQALQTWKVRLQVDAGGECDTVMQIREAPPGQDLVGLSVQQTLRPGINDLTFKPVARYKFQPKDTCFIVTADIVGSAKSIDSQKRFCAKYVPPAGPARWTLK